MEAQVVATNEPVVARNVWNLLDAKMGAKTRARLEVLRDENLEFLEEQISWKDGISEMDAHIHVEEYRKFIALSIVAEDFVFRKEHLRGVRHNLGMPSRYVDLVWHRHILFTREYPIFCEKVKGKMIHHNPCTKTNLSTMTSDETKVIYAILFGPMPEIWSEKESFLLNHASLSVAPAVCNCDGCDDGSNRGVS